MEQQRDGEHRRWRAERMEASAEVQGVRRYVQSLEERLAEYERGSPGNDDDDDDDEK